MTVETQTNKVKYLGNGQATVFPVPYPVLEAGHLQLFRVKNGVETQLTGGYEVLGAGTSSVSVKMDQPLPAGTKLIILRLVPYLQTMDLVNGRDFNAEIVELSADDQEMQIQQLAEQISRAILAPLDGEGLTYNDFLKILEEIRQLLEEMRRIADDETIKASVKNIHKPWVAQSEVASGGVMTLPGWYYPKRDILMLWYQGQFCIPLKPLVEASGHYQYDEIGDDLDVLSNQVRVYFDVKAGDVLDMFVVSSAAGRNLEQLLEAVLAAQASAEAAKKSAEEAAKYVLYPATKTKLGGIKVGDGLGVEADGLLSVDFSQMPTEKFEALLATLRVPIWLSTSTVWYVDGATGSDACPQAQIGAKGRTLATAFKTIQAAVNFVAENFNLGSRVATIDVAAGTYVENVTLPKYGASTGYFVLRGAGTGQTVVTGTVSSSFGTWYLQQFTLRFTGAVTPGSSSYYALMVSGGATVRLSNFTMDLLTSTAVIKTGLRTAGGASIILDDGVTLTGYCGNYLYSDGGNIQIYKDCAISGTATSSTVRALNGGVIVSTSSANGGVLPVISGTVTGTRYTAITNGIINSSGGGAGYFPGTLAGSLTTGGQYL